MKQDLKSSPIPPAFVVKSMQAVQTGILNFANRLAPPFLQVLEAAAGTMSTQVIYAAAKLNLADLLKNGPKRVDDLAQETGSNPDALYRLLRVLASIKIFRESSDRLFEMTPAAETLLSDHPASVRPFALLVGDPIWREPWGDIMYSLKTGEDSFKHVYEMNFFDYLDEHKDKSALFNSWMTRVSNMNCPVIAASYPFSRFKRIVDVGGGHGSLLAHILKKHPGPDGVLFDLPAVVESATEIDESIASRCEKTGGSFFDFVPGGGDLYILQQIIHDWEDELAIKILSNCRDAMTKDDKILVIDAVIKPGNQRDMSKFIDLQMLLINKGGRERTAKEFKELFQKSGFQILKIIPTASMFSIIEGRKS
ncbi:MAG: methyltransferase [Bacteroidales bacterium]|nr:methyltransferase [Bacteroidales bacterium]